MKMTLLTVVLFTAFGFSAHSQKLNAANVPAAVKISFANHFPNIDPGWEKEDSRFEALFKQNGNSMSALFEKNGTMTETEIDIKKDALPPVIVAYVKDHYTGKIIRGVAKITKKDGTINYEVEVNGRDVVFDVSGKFLKTVKD
jgi:hypothetical protein